MRNAAPAFSKAMVRITCFGWHVARRLGILIP
jgi:hypothetical protein